jgi:hypothetical protein
LAHYDGEIRSRESCGHDPYPPKGWTAAGQRFPRLNEIDPWMVGDDWANCLMIAVQSPVELSYLAAAGKNLAVALCSGDTLPGLLLSHLPPVSQRAGV